MCPKVFFFLKNSPLQGLNEAVQIPKALQSSKNTIIKHFTRTLY